MKYRIIKHCWQGAYITDNMNYFTVEEKKVTIISVLKRLLTINNTWYEWYVVKNNRKHIKFSAYMDAYHFILRLVSGDSIGNWKEEVVS